MAWGIIIAFTTLFGTFALVLADAVADGVPEEASSDSFDELAQDDPEARPREAA